MMPLSKDAVIGEQLLRYLAEIYMMCGEYEAAIDQLETLLSVPGYMSRPSSASIRFGIRSGPIRDSAGWWKRTFPQ